MGPLAKRMKDAAILAVEYDAEIRLGLTGFIVTARGDDYERSVIVPYEEAEYAVASPFDVMLQEVVRSLPDRCK